MEAKTYEFLDIDLFWKHNIVVNSLHMHFGFPRHNHY